MPVWVAAAAKAALTVLSGHPFCADQELFLPDEDRILIVPVSSASVLFGGQSAMGISYVNSPNTLDITNNLEIWTSVQLIGIDELKDEIKSNLYDSWLYLLPGFGVGKLKSTGDLYLSEFAKDLFLKNFRSFVPDRYILQIEITLPQGRNLAKRTSNESFGIVEGLSLIGTQAEVQISASPEQLRNTLNQLRLICDNLSFKGNLIFVIGENGLSIAKRLGLAEFPILKVGNWLGPLIVSAAELGVQNVLLLGYHGKLIKLAGGIFHTHNHLADARIEILTSLAVKENLPLKLVHVINLSESIEDAFLALNKIEPQIARSLWFKIANEIEVSSKNYLNRYGDWSLKIGAALFDRKRDLRWFGSNGISQLKGFAITFDNE